MSLGGVRELIDIVDFESKNHGWDLFLVDMLQTGPIANEMDRFYLGKYAALNLHLGLRVAIVYPKEFRNKLFENTATNRGATLIVVSEKEEGIKWLLEGIPNYTAKGSNK